MPPAQFSVKTLVKMRFTVAVIALNALLFLVLLLVAGSTGSNSWNAALLQFGAQFTPLTLDTEPWRLFSHLFLHGSAIQLVINSYFLAYLGFALEHRIGPRKMAFIFFVGGVASAISGMYFNLFTISTGSSGAICGLLGFYLVYNIFFGGRSIVPALMVLLHLFVFAGVNLFFPEVMYADYAGMFAGVLCGIVAGFISFAPGRRERIMRIKIEYLMVPVLIVLFLLLPGYQVRYFKFFKQVVAAEDTTRHLMKDKLTDDDMRIFIRNYHHWEELKTRLVRQPGLPADLAPDTFRLARYIDLRKQENLLKKMVVQREAYAYLDSIEQLQRAMQAYLNLDYGLWARIKFAESDPREESRMTKVGYDSSGNETTDTSAMAYFRAGIRDSLGRWDGAFREYDGRGRLRIKGIYRRNRRDGVFLYYNERGVCVEAGRYVDDKKFGKWQTFFENGRPHTEVFHNNGYFVRSVWDSLGTPLVVDGNGREIQVYPDDVVKVVGEYRHGVKDGTWYGRYPNGDMFYEEIFSQGKLLSGKSRTPDGQTFLYDESSLYPMPEGGFERFQEYLKSEVKRFDTDDLGHVKISFRVTASGSLADVFIDQGATPELDAKAKEILLKGPTWLPARRHGHLPVDGPGYVQIEFY